MTDNRCHAQRLKEAGDRSRAGASHAGTSKRYGFVRSPGHHLLMAVLILLTGSVFLMVSSCSRSSSNAEMSTPTPTPMVRTGVTLENYEKLQNGMTYDEVMKILGDPGREIFNGELAGYRVVTYAWGGDQLGSVKIIFQNDRLKQKSQYGLQ